MKSSHLANCGSYKNTKSYGILCLIVALFLAIPAFAESQLSEKKQSISKKIGESSPIPFTDNPQKQQWRIGFKAAPEIYYLQFLPESKSVCEEMNRILDSISSKYGQPSLEIWPCAVSVPFSKAKKIDVNKLVNPEQWTVINMNNFAQKISFTQLTAFINDEHHGCWFMGSKSLSDKKMIYYPTELIDDHNLVFGIAGRIEKTPTVRTPIVNTTDDPYYLPKGHNTLLSSAEIKKRLGKNYEQFKESAKLDYGQSIKAVLHNEKEPEIL